VAAGAATLFVVPGLRPFSDPIPQGLEVGLIALGFILAYVACLRLIFRTHLAEMVGYFPGGPRLAELLRL
jgi:hypothetical protein